MTIRSRGRPETLLFGSRGPREFLKRQHPLDPAPFLVLVSGRRHNGVTVLLECGVSHSATR
jgi:hypothetical protein